MTKNTIECKKPIPMGHYRGVQIEGKTTQYSHLVWFLNTGYWPDWENKKEVIHHINGDSTDDRFENLQLMTFSEHLTLHNKIRFKDPRNHPNYGSPHSEETKKRISDAQKEEKSYQWKGDSVGISAKHERHRKNPDKYPFTEEDRKEHRKYTREWMRKWRKERRQQIKCL